MSLLDKPSIPTFPSGLACVLSLMSCSWALDGTYLLICVLIYYLEIEYLEAHVAVTVYGSIGKATKASPLYHCCHQLIESIILNSK